MAECKPQKPIVINHASSMGGSEQSIAMAFMNEAATQTYELQSAHFKSLISVDNPYLALFTNLMNVKSETTKKHSIQLLQLQDFLKQKYNNSCPHCFKSDSTMVRHVKVCPSQ